MNSSDLIEAAHVAGDNKNYVLAMSLFEKCLLTDPLNAEANRELGILVYGVNEDFPRAMELIEKSLETNSECADAHFYLAIVLARIGRNHEAEQEYLKALKLAENGNEMLIANIETEYADFLGDNQRFEEAIKHFELALQHFPSYEYAKERYRLLRAEIAHLR